MRTGKAGEGACGTRRFLLLAPATLAFPVLRVAASGAHAPVRIGFLSASARPSNLEQDRIGGFAQGMRELGYRLGTDLVIEWRFAAGDYARLPELVRELLALKVAAIVTAGVPPTIAARDATTTVPIVMGTSTDPIGSGLVRSLARPGGNVTGLSNMAQDVVPKHVEHLRTVSPKLALLAVLVDKGTASHPGIFDAVRRNALACGLEALAVEISRAQDLEVALASLRERRHAGLVVPLGPIFTQQAAGIARQAAALHLPSIAGFAEYALAGGLMSYGQDLYQQYRRAASYVDKILKGARPGELPIEQPTVFQLIVNLHTARQLHVLVPEQLLVSAARVIE
jgi:putative ABC transport system substrate-binding protein